MHQECPDLDLAVLDVCYLRAIIFWKLVHKALDAVPAVFLVATCVVTFFTEVRRVWTTESVLVQLLFVSTHLIPPTILALCFTSTMFTECYPCSALTTCVFIPLMERAHASSVITLLTLVVLASMLTYAFSSAVPALSLRPSTWT